MSIGDEVLAEPFSASARPTPSAEEVAERTRKSQEEHTNNQRPAPGDTPARLGEKLQILSCIHEPEPVHGQIIDQLLALGADVHFVGGSQRTAIIAAADAANAPLVKKLLDHGANPHDSDNPGNQDRLGPAICHAALRNSVEVLRLLLNAGADPDAHCYPGGRTALTLAIDYARTKDEQVHNAAVAVLIEAKANPDKGTKEGFTPLLFALNSKMPHTVQYLLDHGADPELKLNRDRYAPAEAAKLVFPAAEKIIRDAIAAKREGERLARENQEQLDQWMKDGCPAASGAKTMPPLKLKPRQP